MLAAKTKAKMLKNLTISNYALIENLDVDFNTGFSVITGETGAGKSIILGALSLLLGKRADPGVLRDEKVKCIIEGVFTETDNLLSSFFDDNDIDYESDTIIRREILPSGKSRAFVNDTPVNLAVLSFLGNRFVNIHSQHETLELADSVFQMEVLDDISENSELLSDYHNGYVEFKSLKKKIVELSVFAEKSKRDEEYLKFQYDELNLAKLDGVDFDDLENQVKVLENSSDVVDVLGKAFNTLNDDDFAVIDRISQEIKSLNSISSFHKSSAEYANRLESVLIELNDIQGEIHASLEKVDLNPETMEVLTSRLNMINSLLKKHKVRGMNDLILLRDEYADKLNRIQSVDDDMRDLQVSLGKVENMLHKRAGKVSKSRQKGAEKLEKEVLNVIRQLGMKDADFVVRVENSDVFSEKGKDKVSFLFSANPGNLPGDISKIASGGELSRLMLAIKSLVTQSRMLPTVIFDEIDSGVSGEVAGKVGKILQSMAKNHQIIAITHLPQIATKASTHYKVSKFVENGQTHTLLNLLDEKGRVGEVAAMISDGSIPETAIKVAEEMLRN